MKSIPMTRHSTGIKALACGLLAAITLSVAQADERGKQLYVNCQACHGPEAEGSKLMNAPALAGLSEQYIKAQFHKFKDGIRGKDPRDTTGLTMVPMTLTLQSEADIEAVAKYIASIPGKPLPQTITDGNAERGKALYATCQACHAADGNGNDLMNAPSLKFQHDWYLSAQLHKFKDGIRGADPKDVTGGQMRPMAMILADEQAIKDVVAYIHSLSK